MDYPTLRISHGFVTTAPHYADAVRELQRQLLRWSFAVTTDGAFGQSTEAAVKSFQLKKGLKDDGVVGARTWTALLAAEASPIGANWHPTLSTPVAALTMADGKTVALAAEETTVAQGDVMLKVKWIAQGKGNKNCYKTCILMAATIGVTLPAGVRANCIEVAGSEDADARVTVVAAKLTAGRAYIDRELAKSRPVAVGVSHPGGRNGDNWDHMTHHFVLIVGRRATATGVVYPFNDPATSDERSPHFFRLDPTTGNLIHDGGTKGQVSKLRYEMTMVVKSDE